MTTPLIVGLSGGVDSSVAALLLQQQGYAVQGLFMKNWEEDDTAQYCSAAADLQDAQQVCATLGIPLHTINFASEYWDTVFTHCLQEYQAGRTPNPDVLCNREIKFKVFLDYALSLGAVGIATGHYAQIRIHHGRYELLKGFDDNKDQSYFLYMLTQAQLARSYFPIGHLQKATVRNLARQAGFITATKKDSTGLCFIGERPFKEFLARFLPKQPGPIETPEGQLLGQHEGLMYYTIGQRQGLNIGGRADGNGQAWYVVAKDQTRNTLIVGQGHEHPLLFSQKIHAAQLHWIAETPPPMPYACQAKVRYRQADQPCTITAIEGATCHIDFAQPQRAVTPGQSIVFYQKEVCLGGAIITTR